jgi:D-alanine-D-alanine ligase
MTKVSKRIEIVVSNQFGLGSMGVESAAGVWAVLSKKYQHVDIMTVNNLADLTALASRRPDLVFLGTKFVLSNPALGLADPHKIWLSEFLDNIGIAYTGSGHTAIKLELNKELAKQHLINAGLATPHYKVVRVGESMADSDTTLTYPLFVKPTNRGGGVGIDAESITHTFSELQSKVNSLATRLQSDALIEEYLPGREFSIGILMQPTTGVYSAMPLELIAPPDTSGARFLSGQIKKADSEHHQEITDTSLKAAISTLALDAFHALGAQDYGRIDVRLDAAGTPHFLEANLLPSLLDGYGNFPKACLLNAGLSHQAIILRIVDLAFYRHTQAASPLHIAKARQDAGTALALLS